MSYQYNLDSSAVLKVLLHAAKYPYASVNGLLLGKVGKGSNADAQTVNVVDAIPLFHTYLSTSPAVEVALTQVDVYAKQTGLQPVGYYHANELLTDISFGAAGAKIADRVKQQYPCAAALLIDNSQLSAFLEKQSAHLFKLFVKDGARGWVADGSHLRMPAADVADLLKEYHSQGRHHRLQDFDDHLIDISKDWTNPELLQ